jgi:hypothetical protein
MVQGVYWGRLVVAHKGGCSTVLGVESGMRGHVWSIRCIISGVGVFAATTEDAYSVTSGAVAEDRGLLILATLLLPTSGHAFACRVLVVGK